MSINVELLESTMFHILADPQNLDQTEWACGTTRCFAGHAVEMAGAKIDFTGCFATPIGHAYQCITPDGVQRNIMRHAIHILGLTMTRRLFCSKMTTRLTISRES